MIQALARFLTALGDCFRNKEPVAHSQPKAENDSDASGTAILDALRVEIDRRRVNDKAQERLEQKKLCLQRIALLVATATMFAVIYYAWIAHEQLGTMNDTYVEARRSADVAERQQRPWIGLDQRTVTPIESPKYAWSPALRNPTVWISLRYSVKNYGAAPAFITHETMLLDPVPDRGVELPLLRQACRVDAYRTTGQVTFRGDIGQMILPGETTAFDFGTNMRPDRTPKELRRVWITLCFLYRDLKGGWHYSGYRFISSSAGTPSILVPDHPGWSYLPFTGVNLIAASAD